MRRLATLILMAAMVLPVAVAAQSPASGSPLGTLDDFQEFLADHGFMRPLEPNTTAPTQPSSQGWGGSGLVFAWADGPEDALTEVSVSMMNVSTASPAERDEGLGTIRDFLELYAPTASSEIAALDFTPPFDQVIDVDDRLVRLIVEPSESDKVHAVVHLKAAGPIPNSNVTLASQAPSPRMQTEAFSGSDDYNTQRFLLDGGDYTTDQSAAGRAKGCQQSTTLVGPTTADLGRVLTEDGSVAHQQNNLYDIEPGLYYFDVSSTCDWTVSISSVAYARPRLPPPWETLP